MGLFSRLFGHKKKLERQQEQMTRLYQEYLRILELEMYRRARLIAQKRFPDEREGPIGAHIRIYCAGERENDRSLASSTPEERSIAKFVAEEIMACDVPGLYNIRP